MNSRRWRTELICLLFCLVPVSSGKASDLASLEPGVEALRRGEYAQASQFLTSELKAQGRSPELRARAFYLRAKAYAGLKRPLLATADVNIALWLDKLPADLAEDARRLKTQLQSPDGAQASNLAVPIDERSTASTAAASPVAQKPVVTTRPVAVPTIVKQDLKPVANAPKSLFPWNASTAKAIAPRVWSPPTVTQSSGSVTAPAAVQPSSPPVFVASVTPAPTAPAKTEHSDIETSSIARAPQEARPPTQTTATTLWQSRVAVAPPEERAVWKPRVAAPPAATPVAHASSVAEPVSKMAEPEIHRASESQSAPLKPTVPPEANAAAPGTRSEQAALEPSAAPSPGPGPDSQSVTQSAPSAPILGALFQKPPSRFDADIASAEDLERRRIERIRRHNEAYRASQAGDQRSQ